MNNRQVQKKNKCACFNCCKKLNHVCFCQTSHTVNAKLGQRICYLPSSLVMHQHDCIKICCFKTEGGLSVDRGSKMWTIEIRNIIRVLVRICVFMQPSMANLNSPSSRVVKDSTPFRRRILRCKNFGNGESSPNHFLTW